MSTKSTARIVGARPRSVRHWAMRRSSSSVVLATRALAIGDEVLLIQWLTRKSGLSVPPRAGSQVKASALG